MEDAECHEFLASPSVRTLGNPGSHLWLCPNRAGASRPVRVSRHPCSGDGSADLARRPIRKAGGAA